MFHLPRFNNSCLLLCCVYRKQDVLGQIMEMRFSLALLLHQIEQTLKESFGLMLVDVEGQQAEPASATSNTKLENKMDHLTRQMGQEEASHRAEVERNKVQAALIG